MVYNFNRTSGAGAALKTGGTGTNMIETNDRTAVNTFTGMVRYARSPTSSIPSCAIRFARRR